MFSGTLSSPPLCNGVHLKILLAPNKIPFTIPNFFIASNVYVEQVGK